MKLGHEKRIQSQIHKIHSLTFWLNVSTGIARAPASVPIAPAAAAGSAPVWKRAAESRNARNAGDLSNILLL